MSPKAIQNQIALWAAAQKDILGLLLVGSHARNAATAESDIDLIFFTEDYSPWFKNREWINEFGKVQNVKFEDWRAVKTLRVHYQNGPEIEFNFAQPSWASTNPADPGTVRVVSDGAKILFDRTGILSQLLKAIN
jgi:aminoglycoside 6-adenylyltransferase